jgi:protein-disulfide isomerase
MLEKTKYNAAMLIRSSRPRRKTVSPIVYMLIPLAFFLGLGGGYLLWGSQPSSETNSDAIKRVEVSTDDDPSIGPENAAVTIIEFADYLCGYCKEWYDQVFDQLLANYPTQVRFVYRDYAFLTAESLPAAEATECANEQDAYWDFQRALFSQQYALNRSTYLTYAADLGLDVQAFTDCIDSQRYKSEVQADTRDGSQVGVTGTPAFFINGRFISGYLPYEQFKAVVDEELAVVD